MRIKEIAIIGTLIVLSGNSMAFAAENRSADMRGESLASACSELAASAQAAPAATAMNHAASVDSVRTCEPCEQGPDYGRKLFACYDAFDGLQAFNSGDYANAVKLLSGPAVHGDPEAQLTLAVIYTHGGGGVAADSQASSHWYLLSARGGNAEAQYEISHRAEGKQEQLFWLIRSANQEFSPALLALADAEEFGLYGPPNYESAAHRLAVLAERGNPGAAGRLSTMYEYGRGVKRDKVQALMWWDISTLYPLKKIIWDGSGETLKSFLISTMSKEDVEKSEAMALTFLKSHQVH